MPRRPPIDPSGIYHVSSRGSYGRPLFSTLDEHELFLAIYSKTAAKYAWRTLSWTLMRNHHHFVIQLTDGGLSEGMRRLHGTFSRRIHAIHGLTGQGHLVRHGFFGRRLASNGEVLVACRYVDLNAWQATQRMPDEEVWSGYRATVGLEHPRTFHHPGDLLALLSRHPERARAGYREYVEDGLVPQGPDPSPNDGVKGATPTRERVIQSPA
jgi:REP-associated tyrosine transposase